MARIKFGNQKDNSKFELEVVTNGTSTTDIAVGSQSGQSERTARIFDLPPDTNLRMLADELARIRSHVESDRETKNNNPAVIDNLVCAEKAAGIGDATGTKAFLAKAGMLALEVAKKIGADVASKAIQQSLGLS